MDEIAGYRINEQLGSDSSYEYYLAAPADRLRLEVEQVVIKTQQRTLNELLFSKVCKHFAAVHQADHTYLCEHYEVGQTDTHFYVASEHIEGGTLADPAREIDRQDVLEIISEASLGAHTLHESGVAHNDITPRNIFLGALTKLSQVGILSVMNPGQTLAGAQSATPVEYRSPALIQGEAPGRASDIWALGVTLHKALTGTTVYPEMPTDSLLTSVRHVIANAPALSDALRNGERHIIERALGTSSEEPYETAFELNQALEAEAKRQLEMLDEQ